ncbi:MAG: hypothetical protein ACKVVP_10135 [Chloroflexota bacterium]
MLVAIALIAAITPVAAASMTGPITGSGTGVVSSGGGLDPIGDGRFRVSGREYQARFSSDDPGGCFRGSIRISEEAILSVPHYAGTHEGAMVIQGDAGTLQLQYRGSVDRYNGKGNWWVVRGTSACADVHGMGTYVTSLRTAPDLEYRLELRGQVGHGD